MGAAPKRIGAGSRFLLHIKNFRGPRKVIGISFKGYTSLSTFAPQKRLSSRVVGILSDTLCGVILTGQIGLHALRLNRFKNKAGHIAADRIA